MAKPRMAPRSQLFTDKEQQAFIELALKWDAKLTTRDEGSVVLRMEVTNA